MTQSNGLGTLRLVLAGAVIFSHSWELLGYEEPLRSLGSPLSFGDIAVDGFFVLSGYLVSLSYQRDPSGYLWKRARRIFPAFAVCYLLCMAIAPPEGFWRHVARLVTLKPPESTLAGMAINGAAWTISYEFRCYLLAMVVSSLRPKALFWTALGAVFIAPLIPSGATPSAVQAIIGDYHQTARLCGAFLMGVAFRFVPGLLNPRFGVVALLYPWLGEPALIIGLGALMLSLGQLGVSPKDDVSYGLYLYGWPVGVLLILAGVSNPVALTLLTLPIAAACGWVSWVLIERPAMDNNRLRSPATSAQYHIRQAKPITERDDVDAQRQEPRDRPLHRGLLWLGWFGVLPWRVRRPCRGRPRRPGRGAPRHPCGPASQRPDQP